MKRNFNEWTIGVILFLFSILLFVFIPKAEAKTPHALVGVWTLTQYKGNQSIVCYKLLKKNGRYCNLKSTDWDGKQFMVTVQGKYIPGVCEYTECLKKVNGNKLRYPTNIRIGYEFLDRDTLKLTFQVGTRNYEEVWRRVAKAPKY